MSAVREPLAAGDTTPATRERQHSRGDRRCPPRRDESALRSAKQQLPGVGVVAQHHHAGRDLRCPGWTARASTPPDRQRRRPAGRTRRARRQRPQRRSGTASCRPRQLGGWRNTASTRSGTRQPRPPASECRRRTPPGTAASARRAAGRRRHDQRLHRKRRGQPRHVAQRAARAVNQYSGRRHRRSGRQHARRTDCGDADRSAASSSTQRERRQARPATTLSRLSARDLRRVPARARPLAARMYSG